ncbi:MAG: glycosyltransferase family 9 protein, partial [Candidatus Sumerlaeaceae bacterium]
AAPRPWIGLNTGCGSVFRTKLWPMERWIELIRELQSTLPSLTLLLLGGPAEREMNAQILNHCPSLIDTGCDNSLEEFFGIVDACDLVVSSDSLAMHIAIALRKLVVALFGSTSATEIDLYDRGEKVITDFECSPCYLKQCDKSPTCMQAMTGRTVAHAVVRVLQSGVEVH